jgi:malonyl-CoA O-methyltransferase
MRSATKQRPLQIDLLKPDSSGDARPELVLLHGWGSDSRIWQKVVPQLSQHYRVYLLDLPGVGVNVAHNYWRDEALLLHSLAEVMPAKAHLAGWSLGGNLAMAYGARYPRRVLSLSLVATNLSFVTRAGWPCAMPQHLFDSFYRQAQLDPDTALRRFQQLQVKGDPQRRDLARQLRVMTAQDFIYDATALVDALAWLQARDQRQLLRQLALEPGFILGECDQLVPCAFARQAVGLASVIVMPATGHVPMLSHPLQLSQLLLRPLGPDKPPGPDKELQTNKRRIARSFSKAAGSYDGAAELQRAVGSTLLQLLPKEGQPGTGLDLGSGTGFFLPQLRSSCAALDWLGGDIAEGMLDYAKNRQPLLAGRLIAMDAESLPLADKVLQGIYSNLVLQWCQHLDGLFEELRRVIRPGGWIAFSTLLEGTLVELKTSWQQVDAHVHVNHFAPEQAWLQAAQGADLRVLYWQQQARLGSYGELRELMHELKALGAHNVNTGMPSGLTGKRSWQTLRSSYERHRQSDGSLPASWQILYGVLARD